MLIKTSNKSKIPAVVRTALEMAYRSSHSQQGDYNSHMVWSNMLLAADYHMQHPHFGRKIKGNKVQICCGSVLGKQVNLGAKYDLDAGTIQILNMDPAAFGEQVSTDKLSYFIDALRQHQVGYCLQSSDYL